MRKAILFLTFIIVTNIISAQADLKPGYIITLQNDTIWGTGNISKKQDYCIFQPYNKTDYIKYTPDKIFGFRVLKGRFYISKQIKNNRFFLEYLVDGEIDLFVLRERGADRFFIEKENWPLKEIEIDKEEVVYKGEKRYIKKNKKYFGLIKAYMQDSPDMYKRIDDMQIIKQESLIKLARDYHYSVCDDKECINYTKSLPKVSLKLEPFSGINYHNNYYTHQYGVFLNIWRPLKNEKLYFKVGISYSSLPYAMRPDTASLDNKYKINIPFYWQYVHGEGKLKPTIGIGFVNGKFETSLQAGIIYSLSNNFELTFNGSIDSILKLASNLNREYYNNSFGHSIMIGCQIKVR